MTTFTQRDRVSDTWVKMREHLNERIDVLRRKNDADLSESETAMLRGQIKEAKALLALGEEPIEFAKSGAVKPKG